MRSASFSFLLEQGLKIIDLQMPDYLRILETAIQFGSPVLLQNVQEELDPTLAPILNKSVTKVGEHWALCRAGSQSPWVLPGGLPQLAPDSSCAWQVGAC